MLPEATNGGAEGTPLRHEWISVRVLCAMTKQMLRVRAHPPLPALTAFPTGTVEVEREKRVSAGIGALIRAFAAHSPARLAVKRFVFIVARAESL